MSSTNKTTNYELSQFVGADKPAWLADYNSDMSKIDAQMKLNADGVTTASGAASTANTAIGTLSSLTTTDKTDVVTAINEVVSDVTTAQNTANSASTAASTANTNLAKFNLSNNSTLSPSVNKGTISAQYTNVRFATDTTSSIFKIYGRVYIVSLSGQTGTLTVNLGTTSLRPSASYTISTAALITRTYTDGRSDTVPRDIVIGTDGTITMSDDVSLSYGVNDITVILPPCLYFNTNYGD